MFLEETDLFVYQAFTLTGYAKDPIHVEIYEYSPLSKVD